MKNKLITAVLGGSLLLSGLAFADNDSGPFALPDLQQPPVVEIGQGSSNDNVVTSILHIPAGRPVPLKLAIKGSVFVQPVVQDLTLRFRHDLWLYQKWISFDGQNWMPSDKAINQMIRLSIDGEGIHYTHRTDFIL